MARCALFLIQPFITEKYTFWLATGNPCFLCALSDVACCLLYVHSLTLGTLPLRVLFILTLLVKAGLTQSAFPRLSLIFCRKFLVQVSAQPSLLRKYNIACLALPYLILHLLDARDRQLTSLLWEKSNWTSARREALPFFWNC